MKKRQHAVSYDEVVVHQPQDKSGLSSSFLNELDPISSGINPIIDEIGSSIMSGDPNSQGYQHVDQAIMLSFITQVFDAFIDEMQPSQVRECLRTIKYSYEALLKVVVTNFTQQTALLQDQLGQYQTTHNLQQ